MKSKYIDCSEEAIKAMIKLSKDALKDSGKVITKILKNDVPVLKGYLKKSIVAWAKIDYKTGQPLLQVGYRTRAQMKKKYGIKYFANPSWFEFGTNKHIIKTKQFEKNGYGTYQLKSPSRSFGFIVTNPGMNSKNYLKNSVYNNIDKIKEAQSEKLVKLTDMMIENGMNIDYGVDEEIE